MARKASKTLTPVEAEIITVLWDLGAPATVQQVTDALRPKRHYNTVLTILRIMERKQYVKHRPDPKGRGFVYAATITRQVAMKEAVDDLAKRLFGGSWIELHKFMTSAPRRAGGQPERPHGRRGPAPAVAREPRAGDE